jgi:hypothetical protein
MSLIRLLFAPLASLLTRCRSLRRCASLESEEMRAARRRGLPRQRHKFLRRNLILNATRNKCFCPDLGICGLRYRPEGPPPCADGCSLALSHESCALVDKPGSDSSLGLERKSSAFFRGASPQRRLAFLIPFTKNYYGPPAEGLHHHWRHCGNGPRVRLD